MQGSIIVALAMAVTASVAGAQSTPGGPTVDGRAVIGSSVSVRLRDGSVMYGRLERIGSDSVVIAASAGRMAFAVAGVRDVRSVEARQQADGSTQYWFHNSNTTRLLFAPTGRTLAAGEGYFADHWVVLGSVAVGLTDRVTVGGGSFLIPNSDAWFVTPKVAVVRSEKVNVAVGALAGGIGKETGGIAFVTSTFGGADNSFTVAAGNGFSGTRAAHQQLFMLGGERRVSRRMSLITENYMATGSSEIGPAYGVRFLGERISVDLAFLNSGRDPVFPGIPWVDFVIHW